MRVASRFDAHPPIDLGERDHDRATEVIASYRASSVLVSRGGDPEPDVALRGNGSAGAAFSLRADRGHPHVLRRCGDGQPGSGQGNSAKGRLNALRNMIQAAEQFDPAGRDCAGLPAITGRAESHGRKSAAARFRDRFRGRRTGAAGAGTRECARLPVAPELAPSARHRDDTDADAPTCGGER